MCRSTAPDGAVADLNTCLTLDPSMAGAWANLRVLHHEQGDHTQAVVCYDRSLALSDDPDVRANRELALAVAAAPADR